MDCQFIKDAQQCTLQQATTSMTPRIGQRRDSWYYRIVCVHVNIGGCDRRRQQEHECSGDGAIHIHNPSSRGDQRHPHEYFGNSGPEGMVLFVGQTQLVRSRGGNLPQATPGSLGGNECREGIFDCKMCNSGSNECRR